MSEREEKKEGKTFESLKQGKKIYKERERERERDGEGKTETLQSLHFLSMHCIPPWIKWCQ